MKRLIIIGLALVGGAIGGVAGEYAAGTNPALFYWQAFALLPQLSDSEYSADSDYSTMPLNETYDKLVDRFENVFRVAGKGLESKVACEWGIDLSDGPYACLPHLAKAKWITQINANVRGPYFLRKGNSSKTAAETLAVFKLGRDTARDGTLLSILVQGAIESISVKFIADHFGMFQDADIQGIADGMKVLPKHLSVKDAMPVERATFLDWYKNKVESFISHPGEKGALAQSRQLLVETIEVGGEQIHSGISDAIIREAGGTAEGLVAYLNGLAKWYDEAGTILALPDRELLRKLDEFSSRIEKEGSIIAREVLPAFGKAQRKEFWTQTRMAMLNAAIAYRLHGKAGFDSVTEPVADGTFQLIPIPTGFEIRSKLNSEFGPDKEKGKPVALSFTAKK